MKQKIFLFGLLLTFTFLAYGESNNKLNLFFSKNPFSPSQSENCKITFQLDIRKSIFNLEYSIKIFNIEGELIRELVTAKQLNSNTNNLENDVWNGRDNLANYVKAGNYICYLIVIDKDDNTRYETHKRIIVRF